MKQVLVAANWKLNKTEAEAEDFIKIFWPLVANCKNDIAIFPSAILFCTVRNALKNLGGSQKIQIGPQNIWAEQKGAFTGENSVDQAKSSGANIVLIGHSERRQLFGESDTLVNKKVKLALASGLKVVLCVGETLNERESGTTKTVVLNQLTRALEGVPALHNLVIAYEPVWAIGTGKVATPEQAEEVHGFIRQWLSETSEQSQGIAILYGGSVKSDNAKYLIAKDNIDGFLVGGASLDPNEFAKICLI